MKSTVILLLALVASASAHCECNSAVGPEAVPMRRSDLNFNEAQQLLAIAISLLADVPAIPHQLALVSAAMFEAFQIAQGRKRLTDADVTLEDVSTGGAVGYAGYGMLTRILESNPDKIALLDAAVGRIRLDDRSLLESVGLPLADAIRRKYPLNIPPPPYTAPNAPSRNADARCNVIEDSDGWQPLCVTPPTGGACQIQMVPFLPLVNASLITADGAQEIGDIIADIPSPNTFTRRLRAFPNVDSDFTRDYNAVLATSGRLDDQDKITAEVFAPNAALAVHRLTLDEADARDLSLERSVQLFFALSAAVRDAFIGSSTIKVIHSTIRPVTVFQCGFRGRSVRIWRGPYMGVGRVTSSRSTQFRSYVQTPPFPGFISGHTTISSAAATVLARFFKDGPRGANCFIVPRGGSVIEGRKRRGEDGFIKGVTNVPNSGRGTVGFSPARRTTVCWESFREYSRLVARSRRFGLVHTPIENVLGERLGRKVAIRAFRFVRRLNGRRH